jgi:hypothetical protein
MGRATYRPDQPLKPKSVRLFKIYLNSGGYDDGGAYWGLRIKGESLYCALAEDYREFTSAKSREEAAINLKLSEELLCQPTK